MNHVFRSNYEGYVSEHMPCSWAREQLDLESKNLAQSDKVRKIVKLRKLIKSNVKNRHEISN